MIVLVGGVAGSGKTTVGTLLAERLHWPFTDADKFHPAANVAKMRAGVPLTDADRRPWLAAITAWMDERIATGESAVAGCSALCQRYRDELLAGRPEARLAFLEVSRELAHARLVARTGHFFTARLLDSQFADLEPPRETDQVLVIDGAQSLERIVDEIMDRLGLVAATGRREPERQSPAPGPAATVRSGSRPDQTPDSTEAAVTSSPSATTPADPGRETISRPTRQDKPWGHEMIFAAVDGKYVGKIIHVNAGQSLSLQYHHQKEETSTVLSGEALVEHGPSADQLTSDRFGVGDTIHLPPGVLHRITALSDLDFAEVSTAQPGWREDVVRLEDRYGRSGTTAP
jgi:gluconokinase